MKYAHVYALFLMFVFHTSCGQKQTEPHKDNINYSIKDTVTSYGPYRMVRNVKQDRNGNILFAASWGGVFRYDGKSFTNLTSKIGSRRYWDVLEDRRGNLWFASVGSGVYYYNGKSFQHFTTREGLASNQVMSIYEDSASNIWFGASRYDGKSFRNFTTKDGFPSNSIRLLLEDKTGKLWFGTRREPCFYDGKTFTVLKNKDGKAFKNVWSIVEDKKGSIWFGDVDGLWRYDGRTFTKVSQRRAYAIIEDKKGNIWTTGEVKPNGYWGLSRYDQKFLYSKPIVTEIMTRKGPGMLCGLVEASDGSIWYGAMGSTLCGVFRYDGKTITDFRRKEDQK
jgi:ligand-binding sensor domain-containing protein